MGAGVALLVGPAVVGEGVRPLVGSLVGSFVVGLLVGSIVEELVGWGWLVDKTLLVSILAHEDSLRQKMLILTVSVGWLVGAVVGDEVGVDSAVEGGVVGAPVGTNAAPKLFWLRRTNRPCSIPLKTTVPDGKYG